MQAANLPLSWAGLDQNLSHRREGRRRKESFSLFGLFLKPFLFGEFIYFFFCCLALGVKGPAAVEAEGRQLIALTLDSLGRFAPWWVSASSAFLTQDLRPPSLQDLGKLSSAMARARLCQWETQVIIHMKHHLLLPTLAFFFKDPGSFRMKRLICPRKTFFIVCKIFSHSSFLLKGFVFPFALKLLGFL